MRKPKGDGSVFQRKSDGRWVFRLRHKGKDIVAYLNADDEKQATREAAKERRRIHGEIARGEHDKPTISTATIDQVIDLYLRHLKVKQKPSLYTIEKTIDRHIRPLFGDRRAASITTDDLRLYRDRRSNQETRQGNPVTQNTIDHELSYLRSAMRLAARQTPPLMGEVPYFEISGEDNIRHGFIERDGYEKLYAAAPASLRPVICCAYHVGDRRGELLNIRPDQCDLEHGYITLRTGETKNREGRHLPIYGDMIEVLAQHKARVLELWPRAKYLFVWLPEDQRRTVVAGNPIRDFRDSWLATVKAAGYEGLRFHDLRRSAVRNMLQHAGLDEHVVLDIIGHRSDSMLRRYNIVSRKSLSRAKEKLEEWSKRKE